MDKHAKLVAQVRQEFEHEYKDKVVLTREEYESLIKPNKLDMQEQASYIRKQTAEKILNEVNDIFRPFDKKSAIFLDLLLTKLETIVKKI